jgi:hypothetical protein
MSGGCVDPTTRRFIVSIPSDTWDSTAEDLERARWELERMERAPSERRVADRQAWLDACANKRRFIARLEREIKP